MKRAMIAGCLFLLGVLTGCAAPEAAGNPLLTEAANGGTFKLRVGETVRVRLRSNPTTGFVWEFRIPEDGAIALDRNVFVPPENADGRCGAPGTHELVVRAVKPGRAELRGVCRRPWEKSGSAHDRAFRLNVEVE